MQKDTFPKEVKLRDLEKHGEMIEAIHRITGKGHTSQAVIAACYRLLEREKEVEELEEKVRNLQQKVNSYEQNVKSMLMAQNNLRNLVNN